jgi:hypothetical protein
MTEVVEICVGVRTPFREGDGGTNYHFVRHWTLILVKHLMLYFGLLLGQRPCVTEIVLCLIAVAVTSCLPMGGTTRDDDSDVFQSGKETSHAHI